MATSGYAVELRNITKTFGGVVANKNVCLNVKHGEILALLGENGSGKTTLMNILSGIYKPDSGSILVDGNEVVINSPEDSKKLGIGMVYQHFKLVDVFSAADNIWMGKNKTGFNLKAKLKEKDKNGRPKNILKKAGLVAGAAAWNISEEFLHRGRVDEIREIAKKFGFDIDPSKKIYNMSVSEKQTIEILKVLCYGAKTIILDEPTAVLTVQETKKLFDILRKLKEEGHSIIIITHKLNEVVEISDRVSVLRRGELIKTLDTKDTNEQELAELMVGRKVDLSIERPFVEKKKPLLEIRNLTIRSDEGAIAIDSINFYIRGGEILGVAGIAGCGQKELCEAIAGLRKIESGKIIHKGENIVGLPPEKIIERGIAMSFIPEDRLGMGLAPSLSITDNMLLKSYRGKWYNPVIDRKSGRERAKKVISDLMILTPSTEMPVRLLSGGNVQKVLVGRELESGPNVLITAYPVRGLDINSSYAIYNILNEQKKNGVGILYVGEDLDVMMALCDKIMVICHGRLMGVVHAHKTTKEELGLMMTGALDLSECKGKPAGIAKDSELREDQTNE
ncbi:MAG: ABC transporter ATP-binding protein [Eubacteriales bacterium]|jgi:ABC-type uncharacterized transport system ATPase subunit